jgi:ribonuclease P/MRP protein subunit POP5
MKPLPTLKQKKRYLVFEIISDKKFTFNEIKDEMERAMKDFFGVLGLAKSSPTILEEKFNPEKQKFMIKINHKYVDELKSAIILSKSIKNNSIIVKSVIVSGTIKKAAEQTR